MTLDKDNLALQVNQLKKYLKQLLVLKGKYSKEDFMENWEIEDQVSRKLQVAAECILDTGDLLINGFDLQKPETYADIPRVLRKNRKISEELAEYMTKLAKFRNVLVHDYLYINKNEVFSQFEALPENIRRFLQEIKNLSQGR